MSVYRRSFGGRGFADVAINWMPDRVGFETPPGYRLGRCGLVVASRGVIGVSSLIKDSLLQELAPSEAALR
uniref:Uncharacterized protein n=1 Tax=Romanomermis culicivorax TaxID=13658 RepID=A0A915I682_ROMCU